MDSVGPDEPAPEHRAAAKRAVSGLGLRYLRLGRGDHWNAAATAPPPTDPPVRALMQYQDTAIILTLAHFAENEGNAAAVSVPTGTGKSEMIGRIANALALSGCRVLVVAPGLDIKDGLYNTVTRCAEEAGRLLSSDAPVVVKLVASGSTESGSVVASLQTRRFKDAGIVVTNYHSLADKLDDPQKRGSYGAIPVADVKRARKQAAEGQVCHTVE